ncbi:MAG: YceD family protein [Lautropia sp.]
METEKPDRRVQLPGATAPGRPLSRGGDDAGPASPPRVDSVAFARQGEECQGRLPMAALPRLLSAGVAPEGTLQWSVHGSSGRDEMQRHREFLSVSTRFSPWMTCSKCLEPVQVHELESATRFRLAASENQATQEDKETYSVEVIAADPNLDLSDLIEDEAILALPMAPGHADCRLKGAGSAPGTDV